MKLVGLLSFFDEPEHFLHRTISTLPIAGVTHLVALDGRYARYPAAYDTSPSEQHEAIEQSCATAGISLHLHVHGVWDGDEIEKRTALFAIGETITSPQDWYYVVDGDEEIIHAPDDLHAQLQHSVFDVAQVYLDQANPDPGFPKFFRAARGLHCHGNHYTYRTGDGRYLWGNGRTTRLEARLPLNMTVKHHEHARSPARRTARLGYYTTRDREHAETHTPMASGQPDSAGPHADRTGLLAACQG